MLESRTTPVDGGRLRVVPEARANRTRYRPAACVELQATIELRPVTGKECCQGGWQREKKMRARGRSVWTDGGREKKSRCIPPN